MANSDTDPRNDLLTIANDSGLEKPKIEVLLSNFGETYAAARKVAAGATGLVVTDETQVELIQEARSKRLELKNIRLEVESTRKRLKEQSLREGKAIDGMANIIKALIIPVEDHLEVQEKFVERIKIEREARRFAERTAELSKYTDYTELYNLKDMDDKAFSQLLGEVKSVHEAKIATEAAAKKERQEREAEEAREQERIRKENEKLKAERDKREEEIERERAEAERIRKIEDAKREAALKIERAAAEKKVAAERAAAEKKLKAEQEARAAEQKKREQLEREKIEREAAEAKRKAAEDEQKRQNLLAPDKEKLIAFANVIDRLEMPNVANREAGKLLDETQDFLTRISKNLRNKAKEL